MIPNNLRYVRRSIVIAVCVAGATLATPSIASVPDDAGSRITVDYTSLDLANASDAAKLYSRLRAASRAVCGQPATHSLTARRIYDECRAKAVADAVSAVNEHTLTAIHERSDVKSARNTRARTEAVEKS
jgi:UrcA family protein